MKKSESITECYRVLLDQAHSFKTEFAYTAGWNNFRNLNVVHLNKYREDKDKDYREYRAETETEYLYIKVFKNFISMGKDEREMYAEPNSLPVAYFNRNETVTIQEIAEKFEFNIPEDYIEFD